MRVRGGRAAGGVAGPAGSGAGRAMRRWRRPRASGSCAWRRPRRTVPTVPAGDALAALVAADAMVALLRLTARLRRDCPWDREQTARYDRAAHAGGGLRGGRGGASRATRRSCWTSSATCCSRPFFLALLLSEQGRGRLGRRRRAAITAKLIRRHPHVFGEHEADTPGQVRRNWEQIKSDQEGREGIFHDVPAVLPALLHARKVQRRASAVGFDWHAWDGAWGDLPGRAARAARGARRGRAAAGRARAGRARGARAGRPAVRGGQRRPAGRRRSRAGAARAPAAASATGSSGPSSWRWPTASSSPRSAWSEQDAWYRRAKRELARGLSSQPLLEGLLRVRDRGARCRPRHLLRGAERSRA